MKERKTTVSAKLQELIDALDMQNDESSSYFCLDTGEVYVLPHEVLAAAESESDIADLRGDYPEEEVELARRVIESDRYRELPSSYEVHEWRIMESYSYSLGDAALSAACVDAIHRRGAFRNFKNVLSRNGLLNSWYTFRGEALRRIAIEWCEENEIAFEA
jgi:hypothetical protein